MSFFKNNITNYFILFVISILTLNQQDHTFHSNVDFSLFWSFSFLFEHRQYELNQISFIYGPLAFLRSPLFYGNQILIVCLVQTLLKCLFGYCLLRLAGLLGASKQLAILLFCLSCLITFSFETYLGLPVIILLMLYYFEPRLIYLVIVALLTALGYYIKCSIGFSCILIQAGFAGFLSVSDRKINRQLIWKMAGLNAGLIFVSGLLIFRALMPVLRTASNYFHNLIYYNGVSSVYNSGDSFLLLGLLAVSLVSIFFLSQSRVFRLFWFMALILMYTGYSYSIIRMDHAHYTTFITYFFSIAIVAGLFYKTASRYTFHLLTLAFFAFYTNLRDMWDYSDYTFSIQNGPRNIYDYIINNRQHRIEAYNNSVGDLFPWVKLKKGKVLTELKKGSIDFYPWELSYVEANRFDKWKPRPYLQSLIMLSFFDKKTAKYFGSSEAPDHLIWHSTSGNRDFFRSFDDSYLLTNQFSSVVSILSNYKVFAHDTIQLFLKKSTPTLPHSISNLGPEVKTGSGEWIPLPENTGVTGCKVKYHFNLLRPLKKLVYRDDEFFVEYKTESDSIIKRRFWPVDSDDFLVLSPYIISPFDLPSYKKIKAVRFSNTNAVIHSGGLKVQFMTLKIKGLEPDSADFSGLYKWFSGDERLKMKD
ncbi:MAG: hypothetical protein ACXVP0_09050 [Bacteroidia bacterium]